METLFVFECKKDVLSSWWYMNMINRHVESDGEKKDENIEKFIQFQRTESSSRNHSIISAGDFLRIVAVRRRENQSWEETRYFKASSERD